MPYSRLAKRATSGLSPCSKTLPMLAYPGWPTFSLRAAILTQRQIWLVAILVASPSLFTIHLAVLNTPDVNSHPFTADIFLRRPPYLKYEIKWLLPQPSQSPSNRRNSSCVTNSQPCNPDCRSSKRALVIHLHRTPRQ